MTLYFHRVTENLMVRRSTRLNVSIQGRMQNRPGPTARFLFLRRPRRNITALQRISLKFDNDLKQGI